MWVGNGEGMGEGKVRGSEGRYIMLLERGRGCERIFLNCLVLFSPPTTKKHLYSSIIKLNSLPKVEDTFQGHS